MRDARVKVFNSAESLWDVDTAGVEEPFPLPRGASGLTAGGTDWLLGESGGAGGLKGESGGLKGESCGWLIGAFEFSAYPPGGYIAAGLVKNHVKRSPWRSSSRETYEQ